MSDFARRLVRWQRSHGRNGLPWQATRDPYRVWLSEVMLQQTQVATVVPYYERFLSRFPALADLAAAHEDEVLALWSGLGYYSRARNLHAAARAVMEEHGGRFPADRTAIERLPGIGRSTAAAIAAFAFGAREAILDGNVKRVLARHFAVEGFPSEKAVERKLWALAESLLPRRGIETYTQALMDLGATVCTARAPTCGRCPVRVSCSALAADAVERYPAPRPRRAVPWRETAMFVLLHNGDVLLEKRPPTGIWGGLWSLPELAPDADVDAAARLLGCRLADAKRLPPLAHGFTHFNLTITPVLARVACRDAQANEPGRLWMDLGDASGAALPVPVRKILSGLAPSGLPEEAAALQKAVKDL